MSKYTTEVRYICEHYSGLKESEGYASVRDIIEKSRSKVFDFSYPIYDESYRGVLETKILKHFYTREIGAETVSLWKLWLDTRLNEIMPYYNQLYESALLEFNPLYDIDITTKRDIKKDGSKDDTGETESKTKGTGKNDTHNTTKNDYDVDTWNYYSDTPQGGLDGIESQTYLTNATHNVANSKATGVSDTGVTYEDNTDNTGKSTLNSVYNDMEDYIEHVTGKKGGLSYSKMLQEFRETFLNIDLDIIHELDDLFMNLW